MTDVSPTPEAVPEPAAPAPEPVVPPATPVIDKIAAEVLHRLRLAATSSQVETVKSWVRENFG